MSDVTEISAGTVLHPLDAALLEGQTVVLVKPAIGPAKGESIFVLTRRSAFERAILKERKDHRLSRIRAGISRAIIEELLRTDNPQRSGDFCDDITLLATLLIADRCRDTSIFKDAGLDDLILYVNTALPEGKQGFLSAKVAPINEKTFRDDRTIN